VLNTVEKNKNNERRNQIEKEIEKKKEKIGGKNAEKKFISRRKCKKINKQKHSKKKLIFNSSNIIIYF
jgi:hypothetical protein